MHEGLTGQVAIVTGGGSGIGAAIVRRLGAMGARVAIVDSNRENAAAVADELIERGGQGSAHALDVRDRDAVHATIDEVVGQLGRLDILVNSVGAVRRVPLAEMTAEDWSLMVDVNLTGVFHCCQAAVRHMVAAGRGRIVSISSRGAFGASPGLSAYAAAKAGIIAMSRSLAQEVAETGITVNVVAPGLVNTPLAVTLHQGAENLADSARNQVAGMRALIEPEDIAASVAFLCAEEARYITGQTIHVNGGAYMP